MKQVTKKIKVDVYDCTVHLIVTDSIDDSYNAIVNKYPKIGDQIKEKEKGTYLGLTLYGSGTNKKYWIIIEPSTPFPILVHECFHATHKILKERGIEVISDDVEESAAWLMEYIFSKAYQFITKYNSATKS